ncbi:DNA cytosine methyltransferase [Neorhizobium galegae]|uniref:DNA cytosine methyltransferase n=1 Tax=Neorhizobium galegae TaxID=399 RepID=UPI0006277AA8|nr:DNA cytosine methyltransferase [Neorhizobium galegae]
MSLGGKISKDSALEPRIAAIDLFCGVGGLTRGLERAGIDVKLGVDIDSACEYPYLANNDAAFLLKSVADLEVVDLTSKLSGAEYTLLAGCAPCQPFSTYQQKSGPTDERWHLLGHFERLAGELNPDFITMENVPNLARQSVFTKFVTELEALNFHVTYGVVNCAEFGVPQQRQRLVLLASKLGPIALLRTKTKRKTVRQAIGGLPPIEAGEAYDSDPLHQASELSNLNKRRIRASVPGGTWRDWNQELVAECHKRETGKTYPGVYGRMEWDQPAPTMTTQYFGFGNGRFGHPEQDRAISLREGAILQSFPKSYKFVRKGDPIYCKTIGRLIGNAVPVKLAEAIGKSIVAHVASHSGPRKRQLNDWHD